MDIGLFCVNVGVFCVDIGLLCSDIRLCVWVMRSRFGEQEQI